MATQNRGAIVRGRHDSQVPILTFVDVDARIPQDHPLRTIKAYADRALTALSSEFDRMYAEVGRPSIPPERLLIGGDYIVFIDGG